MVTILDVKTKALEKMMDMDLDPVSLEEMDKYVNILRTLTDVGDKGYMEKLFDTVAASGLAKSTNNTTDKCGYAIGGE